MSTAAHTLSRRWLTPCLLALAALVSACATSAPKPLELPLANRVPAALKADLVTRKDPWEAFNRRMFGFNEAVDDAALKPAARAYQKVVPEWLRTGMGNMLGNLGDAWSAANLLLQAKPRAALEMGARTVFNSFFGLAGFFDISDEIGLPRTSVEDLGQTLGVWGVASGPYVVLPLLGPSTVRDGSARLAFDVKYAGPKLVLQEPRDRNVATAIQLLNTRVKLLNAGRVLDDIALDKYVLLRDAYLAQRRSLIYDGDPPEDDAPAPAAPAAPAAPGPSAASAPAAASSPAAAASGAR